MAEYEKFLVRAENKTIAYRKLRRMLKRKGLKQTRYTKIVQIGKNRYRIYYKSEPRKRL